MKMQELFKTHFRSIHLPDGAIDVVQTSIHSCYFIVQCVEDSIFIEDMATKLLSTGCRQFHFYGAKEPIWHRGVDMADVSLKGDITVDNVALTMGYETLDEFVDALDVDTYFGTVSYLFYDDIRLYQEAMALLSKVSQQNDGEDKEQSSKEKMLATLNCGHYDLPIR